MSTRRIVTGHDTRGHSVFAQDGPAPRDTHFQHVPGFRTCLLWGTEPGGSVPAQPQDPTSETSSWVPAPGGTRCMVITFPPDSVMMAPDFDAAAAGMEYLHKLPGLAECFEADSPGMHTTASVDYGVLLSGELHLELDAGATRKLEPHDVVVQNGTRHAWRNRSTAPATIMFVLVGVHPRA